VVKSDGLNIASWLQFLAAFAGQVYKRYGHKVDLLPILQYLQLQLKRNQHGFALILKELLAKMACVEVQEDAYDEQYFMLAAGPSLRELVRPQYHCNQGIFLISLVSFTLLVVVFVVIVVVIVVIVVIVIVVIVIRQCRECFSRRQIPLVNLLLRSRLLSCPTNS